MTDEADTVSEGAGAPEPEARALDDAPASGDDLQEAEAVLAPGNAAAGDLAREMPTAGGPVPPVSSSPAALLRVIPGCLLAWLFPGLGHVALGRFRRGIGFAVVVLGMFVGGLALDGKVYRPVSGEPLSYVAAVGAAGVGIPYAVAQLSGHGDGSLLSAYHDYGNTFTLVAGLLNLLVVIDAYDVALRRR